MAHRAIVPIAACFGLALVAHRFWLLEYQDEVRSLNLADNYGFVGLLVGAVLPVLAGSGLGRTGESAPVGLLRTAAAGLGAAAAAAVAVFLWGLPLAAGLVPGLAVGVLVVLLVAGQSREEGGAARLLPAALLGPGLAFALVRATRFLEPASDLARSTKIWVLVITAVVIGALIVLGELLSRREQPVTTPDVVTA